MSSFNKITIVGYIGRDAEMRYTPQGTAVSNFSVATTEKRKDRAGEMQEVTTWFRVNLFGKQAEAVNQYLTKGRQVYVEGRLRQEEWTDREGQKRTSIEVTASDIQLIGARPEGEVGGERAEGFRGEQRGGHSETRPAQGKPTGQSAGRPTPAAAPGFEPDDDIPF